MSDCIDHDCPYHFLEDPELYIEGLEEQLSLQKEVIERLVMDLEEIKQHLDGSNDSEDQTNCAIAEESIAFAKSKGL